MKLRQLFESPRIAVMAFGRMNPPTIGHQKLVEAVKSHNGDHYVFLSQTQKPKTDPLAFTEKLRYAKFFFPEVTLGHPNVKTPIQALQMIQELGYENVIFVAGSDRVEGFQKLFNQYNGQPDKSGNIPFSFKSIEVVSAGERDPDADGAEGMSASKMRQAAADGNLEAFTEGTPRPELAEEMFAAVRKGMGIKELEPAESLEESEVVIDPTQLREYLRMLIDDAIDKEQDIDKLSKVLKILVGKEIRSRGKRYSITSEDVIAAFEASCKNRRKKTNENKDLNLAIAYAASANNLAKGSLTGDEEMDVSVSLSPSAQKKVDQLKTKAEQLSGMPFEKLLVLAKKQKEKDLANISKEFESANNNVDQMLKDFAKHYSEYIIRRDQADSDAAMVPTLRQANNKMKQIIAAHLEKANQLEKTLTQMGHGDKVQQVKANMKVTPADPSTFDKDI